MSRIVRILIVLMSLLYILTGCYDANELDDLAYVIAIGVDKGTSKKLQVTFQIAIPVNISGEGSSPGKETSTLLTIDADSVYEAVSLANAQISKEVNLSQNKMVVFSEELAKAGLEGYINPFVTNKEIRPRTSVVVCKASSREFLSTITPVLETNPARYLDLILSSHSYSGYNIGTELVDFYWNEQSPYVEPIAILAEISNSNSENSKSDKDNSPSQEVNENPTPKFSGIAVFSGAKMVGELKEDEIIPHRIATNSLQPVNFALPDIKEPNKITTVTLSQNSKCKTKLKLENNIPKINITANIHAQLVTSGSPTDYFENENRYQLAKKIEEELSKLIYSYLNKCCKELKADITGFGKNLRPQYLTLTELEKVDWENIYPNSEFVVNVGVDLNTTQIVTYKENVKSRENNK